MKKTLTSIVALLFIFIAASCKKDSKKSDPAPVPQNPPASGSFSALLSNQLLYSVFGSSTFTLSYSQNMAYFSSVNFTNFILPTGSFLNAGNITLNGLTFKNNFNYYTDSTNTTMSPPFVWQASGGAVPSFSYANNNPYPSFTGYSTWPDTIVKSSGLNIQLGGFSNTDEAKVFVSNIGSTSPIMVNLTTVTSSYSFSPSSITSLSTATTAVIQVDFYKNNIQSINGKTMNFRNVSTYVKTVQVKN